MSSGSEPAAVLRRYRDERGRTHTLELARGTLVDRVEGEPARCLARLRDDEGLAEAEAVAAEYQRHPSPCQRLDDPEPAA